MPEKIDLETVERMRQEGAQLVDTLSRDQYEESHLPGAINIPLEELDAQNAARLDRDRAVIAYCFDYQ